MSQVMTVEQLQAELARLQAENTRLAANQKVTTDGGLKISEKRAISLYGLGRYPVTLHRGQWIKLFESFGIPVPPKMQAFFDKNKEVLDAVAAEHAAARKATLTVVQS